MKMNDPSRLWTTKEASKKEMVLQSRLQIMDLIEIRSGLSKKGLHNTKKGRTEEVKTGNVERI